jgi:CRISPR-associated protein Cas1
VRVQYDDALIEDTLHIIQEARALAASGIIPAPLTDSPKCPGCSLASICLPDETSELSAPRRYTGAMQLSFFENPAETGSSAPVRRLIAPRDDLRPAYLNTHGLRVGKSGDVLQVREKETLKQEIRIGEISQLNLMGNIQITTQAVQGLCQEDIPICYFSQGGWFYGITTGMNIKNVFLRKSQYRLSDEGWFSLSVAKKLVAGKIRNHRTMLQRNHVEPKALTLYQMKKMADKAEEAGDIEELLGIEGNAARLYFGDFAGMIKVEEDGDAPNQFKFDFSHRNRRPPRDAVNSMLSFAYSLLAKDCTIACYAVGFDPMIGFYHQPRFGRPSLALDLMEPFRPLIGESVVLSAINNRMVQPKDFIAAGPSVSLTTAGRKGLLHAYELRMDALVTHPIFDYRVSYRRLLEIQARFLARYLQNEISSYPVFVTR